MSPGSVVGQSAPAVGEPAPAFALTPLRFYDFKTDARKITRRNAGELYEPVRLADFRGVRPVVLVFGSDSASLRAALPTLTRLFREHGDQAQFLLVYIRGAGAGVADEPPAAHGGGARREPRTHLERLRVASSFADTVELAMPCAIDAMDDAAMRAYTAHPARLFLVDRDGRIAFAGRAESPDLDLSALEAALAALGAIPEAAVPR